MKNKSSAGHALVGVMGILVFFLFALVSRVEAATITVTSLGDTIGTGTLRDAVDAAAPGDAIDFAVTGTITLIPTQGMLWISKDVTIVGPGANLLTISADRTFYVFAGNTLTLKGMTITGGNGAGGIGGAIVNNGGTLNLIGTTITGNFASFGGAIFNDNGTVSVIDSTISNNLTTFDGGNTLDGQGGGIYNLGTLTVINSTISENSSANGGGVYNGSGNVYLINSTVSGNTSIGNAGGIGGGMIYSRNSIIAGNTAPISPDVSSVVSQGNTLVGDTTGAAVTSGSGDILDQNPMLGSLADNGGPTQTHALLAGSPAINAGDNALALDITNAPLLTDQRGTGFVRIFGGTVDIGAFESQTAAVVYEFSGFLQPVDNMPTLNIANAGSAIPVKFSLAGYQGLAIFAAGYPASGQIACEATEPGAVIEETSNAGGSSLSYDASADRYNYVWKTDRAWSGTCRILVVRFIDGTDHLAKFRFR